MNSPTRCPRCKARFREEPSCGKTVHSTLPSVFGERALWQFGLAKYDFRGGPGDPVTDLLEATRIAALGGVTEVEDEQAETGVWLGKLTPAQEAEVKNRGLLDLIIDTGDYGTWVLTIENPDRCGSPLEALRDLF